MLLQKKALKAAWRWLSFIYFKEKKDVYFCLASLLLYQNNNQKEGDLPIDSFFPTLAFFPSGWPPIYPVV